MIEAIKKIFVGKIDHYASLNNIWPVVIGTSACSSEFLAAWRECRYFYSSRYLGLFPPEQADVLIIYGHVNRAMLQLVLDSYNRMPNGKKVMLVGSRTFESGLLKDSYWGGIQVSDYIPVDVKIAGDPPSKNDILAGFRKLSETFHFGRARP